MRRHGWQKRPPTTPRQTVPSFEVVEDPDEYERRLEDMREEMHALDEQWERAERLAAHDFTGALPVAHFPDGSGLNDSRASGPTSRAPREHTSKEAA